MSREIIIKAFAVALDLPAGTDIEALELGVNPQWDSIGHMALVAELEERFGIALETDDLIAMNTFAASIEILKRYGVAL
jgi:acyl carrier protein